MKSVLSNIPANTELAASLQLQQLLQSLGVRAALFAADGRCVQPVWSNTPQTRQFSLCNDCLDQAMRQYFSDMPHNDFCTAELPDNSSVSVIPLKIHRRIIAYLVYCCRDILAEMHSGSMAADKALQSVAPADTTINKAGGSRITLLVNQLLQALFEKIQVGYDRANELDELAHCLTQSYDEISLLHHISEDIRVNRPPRDFFENFLDDIAQVVQVEQVLVFWLKDGSGFMDSPEIAFYPPGNLSPGFLDTIWLRSRDIVDNGPGILLDSNHNRPFHYSWPEGIRNILSIPIQRGRRIMGIVVGINKISRPEFNSIDIKLLKSVANEFSVFLDNYLLYNDLQQLLHGSLLALTRSVDAKDPYTCGHSERVALVSRLTAESMGLDDAEIQKIYLAGLLHDVGKIGIEDKVLCKSGRLDQEEYRQIMRHPQIGADILRPIKQMEDIARGVLSHHEWYDGRGYPNGLVGEDIPLAGRIVMLADSFDAMIARRTYKNALPVKAALAEINRFSGTQFDPHVVEAFIGSGQVESLAARLDRLSATPVQERKPLEGFAFPLSRDYACPD